MNIKKIIIVVCNCDVRGARKQQAKDGGWSGTPEKNLM